MLFWLIGILLMGGLAALGRLIGATRFAIILVGLWISQIAAFALDARLVDWMLNKEGKLANPLLNWVLPAVIIYAGLAVVFIIVSQVAYTKILVHYKYHVPDERRVSWERMDRGVGIPVGIAMGATLMIQLGVLIHAVGYWTVQLTSSTAENNGTLVKVFTPLKKALHGSGLEHMVLSQDPCPDMFYDMADVVGIVFNNPSVTGRLAVYPGTLTIAEMDAFKAVIDDSALTPAFTGSGNIELALGSEKVANGILYNAAMRETLFGIDWADLKAYLETGSSPKYEGEKLLGKRRLYVTKTRVGIQEQYADDDKDAIAKLARIRQQFPYVLKELQLLAGGDKTVMLKGRISGISDLRSLVEGKPLSAQPKKAPDEPVVVATGTWDGTDPNYTITWGGDNGGGACSFTKDGYLLVPLGASTLVFGK